MKLIPLKETLVFLNNLLIVRVKKGKYYFFSVQSEELVVEDAALKALRGDNEQMYVFILKPCAISPAEYPDETLHTVAAIMIAYYDHETDHFNPDEINELSDKWLEIYSVDNHTIGSGFLEDGMLNNDHNKLLFRNLYVCAEETKTIQ